MPDFRNQFQAALGVPKEAQPGGAHWRRMLRLVRDTKSAVKAALAERAEHRSAIAWAMQWLTYAMFHHGPVRDSLAWDVIKVTIVDACELPVCAPEKSQAARNYLSLKLYIILLIGYHIPRLPTSKHNSQIQECRS